MSLRNVFNVSNFTEENDDLQIFRIPSYVDYIMRGFISMIIILNIPSMIVLFFTKVEESNFVRSHILSLSFTDCGVGLSLLLAVSTETFTYWDCLARVLVFLTMYASSMTQVAVICVERVLVFHSLAWKSIIKTSTLLLKIVLATFLITFLISVTPFSVFITPGVISICTFDNVIEEGIPTMLLYFGIIFACLEVIVILCTTMIIRFLWKHKLSKQRVLPHTIINQSQNKKTDKETRAMVTLGIIVALLITLTTPIHVIMLVYGITGKAPQREIFVPLMAISCLNSACNPVVYSCRIPEMREAFKNIWYKMRCR